MRYLKAIKNSLAYNSIKQDIDNNILGHAYLIISYDIELVRALFINTACSILAGCDCLECSKCHRIINHNHPDIRHIESKDNSQIKVDDIKEIFDDINLSTIEDTNIKLYFIYNGELVNAIAQNKLLKTLEETPKGVTIFIATSNESAILDTVKSRVRKLYLDILDVKSIITELEQYYPNKERVVDAAYSCGGIIGIAERLLSDDDYQDSYNSVWEMLQNMKTSRDILNYSVRPFMMKEQILDTLDILEMVIRDLMAYSADKNVWARHKMDEIENICSRYSLKSLAIIQEIVLECKAKLSYNCNATNVSDYMLFKILEVRYTCQK